LDTWNLVIVIFIFMVERTCSTCRYFNNRKIKLGTGEVVRNYRCVREVTITEIQLNENCDLQRIKPSLIFLDKLTGRGG